MTKEVPVRRIYFRDNCAWFEEGYVPTEADQILLKLVTESLGGHLPKVVTVDETVYRLGCDGLSGMFRDLTSFAEYSVNEGVPEG